MLPDVARAPNADEDDDDDDGDDENDDDDDDGDDDNRQRRAMLGTFVILLVSLGLSLWALG